MANMNDLKDLLKHDIDDIYSAEEQILEALPAMISKSQNELLKKALEDHLKVTEEQKNRLDRVKNLLMEGEEQNKSNKGFLSGLFSGTHKCKAMAGIIDEGQKVMSEDMDAEVMDAAIIGCAQKVEHYEITSYGTARAYADELGLNEVASLLETTLDEEYDADDRLTELAVGTINKKAESGSGKMRRSASRESSRSEGNKENKRSNSNAKKTSNAERSAPQKKAAPKKSAPKKAAKKAAPKKASPKKAASKKAAKKSAKAGG